MHGFVKTIFAAAALFGSAAKAAAACDGADVKVIKRDVAIIGGGASGAHAAVWLRDHGKSVVVVEKNKRLGGHTAAYIDPATNKHINVGVQGWYGFTDGLAFAKRMNVTTNPIPARPPNEDVFVNFATGRRFAVVQSPGSAATQAALQRYHDIIDKYSPLILPGYFNFPSDPAAIPEDLIMPFRDFVDKYDLHAAVARIWDSTGMGLGNMMDVPTLFLIAASPEPFARALIGTGGTGIPASGRLADLYDAVAEFLEDDVLYSSTVASSTRPGFNDGVQLCVNTSVADGPPSTTRVEARRLLIAVEPTPENIAPLDMDANEAAVLQSYKYATVYAGVIRSPALRPGESYINRAPNTLSSNYTEYPQPAQLGRVDYVAGTTDLFRVTAVGTEADTEVTVAAVVSESIRKMAVEREGRSDVNATVEFLSWEDHGKMHARVSSGELRKGFIADLTKLNGQRATWYTGAAFSAGFSTVLWDYNGVLLPQMLEGM